jgi:hypothetical protein
MRRETWLSNRRMLHWTMSTSPCRCDVTHNDATTSLDIEVTKVINFDSLNCFVASIISILLFRFYYFILIYVYI